MNRYQRFLTLCFFFCILPFAGSEEFKSQILLDKINQWFENAGITVISLSKNPVFIDRNVPEIKAAFRAKIAKNPEIINIFYGAAEGYFRLNSLNKPLSPTFKYKARPWYYQAMAMKDLIFTEPYIDINTRASVVTAAYPVKDSTGKIHGVVGADILVNTIVGFLNQKSQEIKEDGSPNLIFIMNPQGDELISSFQSITNGFVKKIGQKRVGNFRTENMLTEFVRYRQIRGVPWYLLEFTNSMDSNYNQVFNAINDRLTLSQTRLDRLARNDIFLTENRRKIKDALAKGMRAFTGCQNLSYAGIHREFFLEGRRKHFKNIPYKTMEWFIRTKNILEPVVSNKSLDPVTRKQIITLSRPLLKKGKLFAILAADITVDFLIKSLKKAKNLCCLMNTEGHIVLSRNSDTMKKLVVDRIALQKKYRFKEQVTSNNVDSELEFNRIHLADWFLIMQKFSSSASSE
ncbi:cache domain-containing protein [Candidatus Riflebacteria bacterium]